MNLNLGPLEHLILRIVWKQKSATVYSVIEDLDEKKCLAYTTVMTIMGRLTCKGILKREKKGKVYFYKPAQTKKVFVRALVRKTVSNCVDRFGDEAVTSFQEEINSLTK